MIRTAPISMAESSEKSWIGTGGRRNSSEATYPIESAAMIAEHTKETAASILVKFTSI